MSCLCFLFLFVAAPRKAHHIFFATIRRRLSHEQARISILLFTIPLVLQPGPVHLCNSFSFSILYSCLEKMSCHVFSDVPFMVLCLFSPRPHACWPATVKNADKAEAMVRAAAARGAQVILLQELFEVRLSSDLESEEWPPTICSIESPFILVEM